jgi:arginine/ornithine N-succinyltransferase beta subunit
VRIVKESVKTALENIVDDIPDSESFIILKTHEDFRACIGKVHVTPAGGVTVDKQTAETLEVSCGDQVRFGPLKPRRR